MERITGYAYFFFNVETNWCITHSIIYIYIHIIKYNVIPRKSRRRSTWWKKKVTEFRAVLPVQQLVRFYSCAEWKTAATFRATLSATLSSGARWSGVWEGRVAWNESKNRFAGFKASAVVGERRIHGCFPAARWKRKGREEEGGEVDGQVSGSHLGLFMRLQNVSL